jgi:polyferredoxin
MAQTTKTRQRVRAGLIVMSFFLFPVTFYYLSPAVSTLGALEGVITGAVLLFAAQFASALVLGRAFCGWVCPGAGGQEALFRARDRHVAGGRWNWIKYFIWVPWLGNIVFALVRLGVRRVDPLYMTNSGLSAADVQGLATYIVIIGLLVLAPSLVFGRRAFCHYLCWMAPFMVIGRRLGDALRIPALRLRAERERCTKCGTCTANCPMSLEVQAMVGRGSMRNDECILCGACADSCPKAAISLGWKAAKKS